MRCREQQPGADASLKVHQLAVKIQDVRFAIRADAGDGYGLSQSGEKAKAGHCEESAIGFHFGLFHPDLVAYQGGDSIWIEPDKSDPCNPIVEIESSHVYRNAPDRSGMADREGLPAAMPICAPRKECFAREARPCVQTLSFAGVPIPSQVAVLKWDFTS